jgi:hypothetical protein
LTAVIPVAPLRARNPLTVLTTLGSDAVLGTAGTVAGFAALHPGARLGAVDPSATLTALISAGVRNGVLVVVRGDGDIDRERTSASIIIEGVACGSTVLGAVEPDTACNCRRTVHPNLAHEGGSRRFRMGAVGERTMCGPRTTAPGEHRRACLRSCRAWAIISGGAVLRLVHWDLPTPHPVPRQEWAQLALTHGTTGPEPPAAQCSPQHVTPSGVPTTHPAIAGEQDSAHRVSA